MDEKATIFSTAMFLCGIVVGFAVCLILFMPRIIDYRAKNLGFMQYNGKLNRMIYKDDIKCNKWSIRYLKYGTMKDR